MRLSYSDHLVALVSQAEAAATRLAAADPALRHALAADARRESARLSARLDASPLTDVTADAVDQREARGEPWVAGSADGAPLAARVAAGWAQTLKVDQVADQDVAALEYANLLACFDAEPALAETFLDRPRESLVHLHGVICRGLLEPGLVGRPRRTDLAVHDGAQGRVLYHPAPPQRIDGLLDELAEWLAGSGGTKPALVVAGVVHERLLQWQPFEAANGRLGRAASRVVLRARGLDPDGVAVAERLLAADPLRYHAEVAATIRRRDDFGPWLERVGEAVVAGLVAAADAVGPRPPRQVPSRATAIAMALEPGTSITVTEYRERSGASLGAARSELAALVAAGELVVQPRAGGLRFRRV